MFKNKITPFFEKNRAKGQVESSKFDLFEYSHKTSSEDSP